MVSLPLYTQNEIYNLVPGEVNWKKGDTVRILPTFPYYKPGQTSFFPTNYNTRGQFLPRVKMHTPLDLHVKCAYPLQDLIQNA